MTNFSGKITKMLTVWRKLHVEVDSMGEVTGNTISGQMDVLNNGDGTSTCITNHDLNDDIDRFVPGMLSDSTGNDFSVTANTKGANFTLTVNNLADGTIPSTGDFTLLDDDTLQDGGDVPKPVTSLLADLFKPAYIVVDFAWAEDEGYNSSSADFLLNFSEKTVQYLETVAKPSRNSKSQPNFWTTHCLAAFQYVQSIDRDPNQDIDAGEGGVSNHVTAFVFVETGNEIPGHEKAHLLGHEVGHNFGLPDEYNMNPPPADKGILFHGYSGKFTAQNLHDIRSNGWPSNENLP